jgi:DNA-directed RNA polymerase subunit RPC12/RpoP
MWLSSRERTSRAGCSRCHSKVLIKELQAGTDVKVLSEDDGK